MEMDALTINAPAFMSNSGRYVHGKLCVSVTLETDGKTYLPLPYHTLYCRSEVQEIIQIIISSETDIRL